MPESEQGPKSSTKTKLQLQNNSKQKAKYKSTKQWKHNRVNSSLNANQKKDIPAIYFTGERTPVFTSVCKLCLSNKKKLYTTARGEREGRQGSQSDETQGGEPLNRQE